jgi:hypothetical protein
MELHTCTYKMISFSFWQVDRWLTCSPSANEKVRSRQGELARAKSSMNIIVVPSVWCEQGTSFISFVDEKGKVKKKTEQIFFSRLTRIDFLPFQFDNTRLSSRAAVYTHYLGPYLGFLQLYVYLDGCVQQSDTCFYRLYSSHFTFFYFLYYASEFITQTTSIQNCTGAQTPLHLPCLNI